MGQQHLRLLYESRNAVWDVAGQTWVAETQPTGGGGGGTTDVNLLSVDSSLFTEGATTFASGELQIEANSRVGNPADPVATSDIYLGPATGTEAPLNSRLQRIAQNVTIGNVSLENIDSTTTKVKLTPASSTVSSIGNNTCITPTAGKKLRISYLSYNPIATVTCAFRFAAAGDLFLQNVMPAGSIVAKDFGDLRYIEGAINEALILNLSSAVSTVWNCFYVEV